VVSARDPLQNKDWRRRGRGERSQLRHAPSMSRRRHDQDAGGSPDVLATKAAVREAVWRAMSAKGVARFPGPDGRIPNFVGAEAAAERLRGTDDWRAAHAIKANPDAPQWPVRQRALEDAKTLYMAVPRLARPQPFIRLDPAHLGGKSPRAASSIKGAEGSGRPVDVEALDPVDLVVMGCVAVGEDGARLGKGGGFGDLEFAIASAAGLIRPTTVVVTTAHERQVLEAGEIPMTTHDVYSELIVTPERILRLPRSSDRGNSTIEWPDLTDEKIASIPLLRRLHERDAT
jgi:5-formyltetrahydrofolate cyclo-ligase